MAENTSTKQLLPPFALIDSAWQAYLKRVPLFTKIVLAPTLFYLVLDTLAYVASHGVSGQPLVMVAQTIEHNVLFTIPLYILAIILQTFSTAAILAVLTNTKITSVSTAYQEGANKILSFWWISILSFLIISGGFILAVIPGIIFSVWFTFAQYILFKEGKKGIQTLLQSREYVRGYFWQVAGRILFISLIVAALSSLAGFVTLLVNNGIVGQISQSFVSLITVPLAMLYQYNLYENIAHVHEITVTKTKAWWLYLIGLLLPVILLITLSTIIMLLKPFTVSDNAMKPTYQKGEKIVMGAFPGVTATTRYVIYKKGGKLLLRRVLASYGEKLQRKGDNISVVAKEGGSSFFSHNATYAVSFFKPPLSLKDGQTITVGVDDVYIAAENVPTLKETWEKITIDQVVGVPLFCYWGCTGKE